MKKTIDVKKNDYIYMEKNGIVRQVIGFRIGHFQMFGWTIAAGYKSKS